MGGFRYIAAFSLAFIAMNASADYFYWMVTEAPGIEFNYATIKAVKDSSEKVLDWYDGEENRGALIHVTDSKFAAPVYSGTFTSDAVESFIVELYNYSDTDNPVGTAQVLITAAKAHDSIATFHGGATPFSVVASPAPEPTSDVLILFGMALLSMKRKNNIKDVN